MIFPRTKLIEKFNESFNMNAKQFIAIVGKKGIGKSTFLSLIEESEIFITHKTESVFVTDESSLESLQLIDSDSNLIIIDSNIPLTFIEIQTFIESNSPDSRVIFTSEEQISDDTVENFLIDGISFREYAEGMSQIVDIGAIMSGSADINRLNELRDIYIHLGHNPAILNNPNDFQQTFDQKISDMNQELFKKEEGDFLEFIRTVAMNVGDIFKEERIAKSMNISRRKVRKYTEILLKYNLIRAVGPWVENTSTELFRHVKIYFTDLAYFHSALGVGYYHGDSKQGVMENFILLELDRKLSMTHDIRFYRKKSGAEVSFILIERSTNQLTPIEITTRSTDVMPLALRIFHETYGNRIEHAMLMNDSIAIQKDLSGTPVIILPHIAI